MRFDLWAQLVWWFIGFLVDAIYLVLCPDKEQFIVPRWQSLLYKTKSSDEGQNHCAFLAKSVQDKVLRWGATTTSMVKKSVAQDKVLLWRATTTLMVKKSVVQDKVLKKGQNMTLTVTSPLNKTKSYGKGHHRPRWSKSPLYKTKSPKRGIVWPWWLQVRCTRQSPLARGIIDLDSQKSIVQDKVLWEGAWF